MWITELQHADNRPINTDSYPHFSISRFPHMPLRYPARMSNEAYIHNGEINDYVRRNLAEQAAAKAYACKNLITRIRTEQPFCFSLHTALELYAIERPVHCKLPSSDFYITVRKQQHRSSIRNVSYQTWSQPYETYAFPNGLVCMHPIDTWIQYAQHLSLTELVVLGEAIIRRFGYSIDSFRYKLTAFHRVTGRKRCEEALKLMQQSDSVQETRARLALLRFGLANPVMHYSITNPQGNTYIVDMAYPDRKVAIEYDGDHHRRFRNQYVRDQRKRRELRALGWIVIEVFAEDLKNEAGQRAFANNVASALHVPLIGTPQKQFCALVDPKLRVNARRGERRRYSAHAGKRP